MWITEIPGTVVPAVLTMALLLSACGGGGGGSDGGGTVDESSPAPTMRSVEPSATGAGIDMRSGSHLVAVPARTERSGRLLVFYPGTGARPEQYRSFLQRAAERGYHAISLDYENSQSINFDVCPGQARDCPELARLEILTGAPSPYIEPDVNFDNSAFNRLSSLLDDQSRAYPDEAWDAYISPRGEPEWSKITVAGHSQGGGHAAMTARLHAVPRVILFGATEPAPWTSTPFATSPAHFLGLVHDREPIRDGVVRSWDNIGIPGATVNVSTSAPPIAAQRLITTTEDCTGDPQSPGYYHNCYIVDDWMPAYAESGAPAYGEVWDYLLTRPIHTSGISPATATRLTPAGESWLDPEVLRTTDEAWMGWQNAQGEIWVAGLDLLDGTIAGAPLQLGAAAAPLLRTFNGPEFGMDINGWAVYYTQLVGGVEQAARATLDGTTEVLTAGEGHFSPLPTRNADDASTRLLMLRRPPDWGTLLWTDSSDPATEHELSHLTDREEGDARWVEGSAVFATNAHPLHPGRIVLVDSDTGKVSPVSERAGSYTTPYAWHAPEAASGGLLVLAVIDGTRLQVWAPSVEGGWQPYTEIASPSGEHPYIGSPEPFVAGGHSYVSLTVRDTPEQRPGVTDAQVWLVGIDSQLHFRQRCDDAAMGPVTRVDPEVLDGAEQVFVYYYILRSGTSEAWRCTTGIATG